MASLPQFFYAKTKDIILKSLKNKVIQYPGICYVEDGNYLVWLNKDNTLNLIGGYNQITNISKNNSTLNFFNGNNILFSADISISDDELIVIKDKILSSLNLNEYVTLDELDNQFSLKLGNLKNQTVTDYIKEYVNSQNFCSEDKIKEIVTKTISEYISNNPIENEIYEKLNAKIEEKGDVKIYNSISELPAIGKDNTIYICKSENKTFRWDNENIKFYCIGSNYENIKFINCGNSQKN